MATVKEIEEAIQQDETFLRLMQTDTEKAIQFAEEAFKMADDRPQSPKPPSQPEAQPDGPVRTFVRPILEAGGAIGGGLMGLPSTPVLGPAGPMIGGVLGGAGGSALADVVEQFAGEQRPPQTVGQAVDNTIRNVQTGAMAEAGGQAFNLGVKGVQFLKAPLKGSIDAGKRRVMEMAHKMGVDLSPGDITGSHTLAMFIEGISERTPFSAGQVHAFRMGGLKKLVERRNDLLDHGGTPQSIEETGIRIQKRVQELMDELGVTHEQTRQRFMESTLEKLGSKESFEALGQSAQDAVQGILKSESNRVSGLFADAFSLAPAGERIAPQAMNNQARVVAKSLENIDESLIHPKVLAMIRQFRSSGNKAYDAQQAELEQALVGVPPMLRERAKREYLEGRAIEQAGWNPHELNALRSRINTVIDELDAGLKLTGEVGVKGVGKSSQNIDKGILIDLKKALDRDVAAFSESMGGEFQGALELARATAGNVKAFANAKGVQSFMKAQPQEAARMLAQSKDLQTIRHLKTVLGPRFKAVEDAFANELMGVGREGTITPAFLRSQLNKYPKGVAEAMLGKGKVEKIAELADQIDTLDASAIQNPIFKMILKANPQSVADLIVKPGNTQNIQELRKMLGQEAVEDLARGMANKILRKPTFEVPQEEFMISPAKLLSGLKRLGDDTLEELYKHDPKFLNEIRELSEVANASQGAARLAANPSGTGQSLIAFGEASMMVMNPANGIKIVLGIPLVTKLYLSKTGRKWLTEGFKTSPNSAKAAEVFGKIMSVATADATVLPEPTIPPDVTPLTATQQALSLTHPLGRQTGTDLTIGNIAGR